VLPRRALHAGGSDMMLWVLAGMFTAATAPFAAAAESSAECQLDQTRRPIMARSDEDATGGGSDTATARPTVAAREGVAVAPPELAQREVTADAQRRVAERRRNGKPIPDAELIGPRRAL
jgi:hypothetical protein